MPSDSPEQLADFQSGGVRMVYGREKENGALYLLQHGAAKDVRTWVKANLECVVPDCPTRDLTTVSRPRHRDGFRHLVAADHPGMSELHAQAQFRLRDWLQSQASDARVDLEMSTENRNRRADVMLTRLSDQIAFEIQYSALEYDYFATRSDSYMRQVIPVIWLFGSVGPQFKVGNDGLVRLNKVQKALCAARQPVFWFNPITLQIAVA